MSGKFLKKIQKIVMTVIQIFKQHLCSFDFLTRENNQSLVHQITLDIASENKEQSFEHLLQLIHAKQEFITHIFYEALADSDWNFVNYVLGYNPAISVDLAREVPLPIMKTDNLFFFIRGGFPVNETSLLSAIANKAKKIVRYLREKNVPDTHLCKEVLFGAPHDVICSFYGLNEQMNILDLLPENIYILPHLSRDQKSLLLLAAIDQRNIRSFELIFRSEIVTWSSEIFRNAVNAHWIEGIKFMLNNPCHVHNYYDRISSWQGDPDQKQMEEIGLSIAYKQWSMTKI